MAIEQRARQWASACPWYVVAGMAWLGRYATLGHPPWSRNPIWLDWFDQSRYFASAIGFAQGNMSPAAHWYPLAYPLLAAPFTWFLPHDPFFLLDLLLFLLACRAFQNVVARSGIGCWLATFCFLATTLVDTKLAGTWAHPWTTTLSATLIWWLIDRTLLAGERGAGKVAGGDGLLFVIGALATALPLVRPLDVLVGFTCVAVVVAGLVGRRQLSVGAVVSLGAGGAVVAGVYGALHLAIYGPHPTPYMLAAAATGFIWSDLGWKAYVLLVHAQPWFPDGQAMVERLPWIVPGCAGLVAAAIVAPRRERRVPLLLLSLMLPVSAIMLTYADLQPPGLWTFANVHYFKWLMPAFGAGVVLGIRQLGDARGRRVFAGVLAALLLPLGIRMVPAPVGGAVPARMLFFRGDTHRIWNEAYFSPVVIDDSAGRMANVGDFHQIPDPAGERAVAISRLFGRDPRRTDPGDRQAGARQSPFARFGERLSFVGF